MVSKMKKSNNNISSTDSDQRKPVVRRRSHTRRRVPQDFVINMAEARREIVHALHLHRSSASSSRTSSSSSCYTSIPSTASSTASSSSTSAAAAIMLGNYNSNYFSGNDNEATAGSSLSSSSQCHCYSLTESMPRPEPIWSTTEPSIPAAGPVPVAAAMEGLEFEWGENQAASYSWWLGFLKALDSKNDVDHHQNYSKYQCLERINVMGKPSWVFGHQDSCKLGDHGTNLVDANHDQDHQQNPSSPHEWLMFPTTDDHQNEIANKTPNEKN